MNLIAIHLHLIVKYFSFLSGVNFLMYSGIFFLKRTAAKKADYLLGATFLLMSFYNFFIYQYFYAQTSQSQMLLSAYLPFDFVISLLMGPAIYFYLQIVLHQQFVLKTLRNTLHLLPALLAFVGLLWFMFIPVSTRVELLVSNFKSLKWQVVAFNSVFFIQMSSYLIVCYRQVNKQLAVSTIVQHRHYSIDISWLRTFFRIDLGIMLLSAPICFGIKNDLVNTIIALSAINIQFVYIFIKAAWQNNSFHREDDHRFRPEIVQESNKEGDEPDLIELPNEPLLKLPEEKAARYVETLMEFMKTDRAYLDPKCSIADIAAATEIPLHHLSNVLNNHLNKNFFDFVNEYRTLYAQKLITDKNFSHLTLEAIGYECGFGSKTSFNKAFKKHTGCTPSEFKQKNSTK